MARIPLDFSKIEDKAFPIFPAGKYTLRIAEVRQEAAKSSGELKESVQFEIVDGPNGSTEFNGKKIFGSYSLQAQAAFRMKKLLSACSIAPESMADLDDQTLVGCVLSAQIAIDMYKGNQVNRVQNEEPHGVPAGTNLAAIAGALPTPTGFQVPAVGGAPSVPGGWAVGFAPPTNGAGVAPAFAGAAPAAPPAKAV